MGRLIYIFVIIFTIGCTSSRHAKVSWDLIDNCEYDLYLVELSKIIIVDTVSILQPYYIGRLTGTSFIFKSYEDDGKMVLVGIKAVDSTGQESEWSFAEWYK